MMVEYPKATDLISAANQPIAAESDQISIDFSELFGIL
jgi:hypothetical protein